MQEIKLQFNFCIYLFIHGSQAIIFAVKIWICYISSLNILAYYTFIFISEFLSELLVCTFSFHA
jgi:hypothetical protein